MIYYTVSVEFWFFEIERYPDIISFEQGVQGLLTLAFIYMPCSCHFLCDTGLKPLYCINISSRFIPPNLLSLSAVSEII